MMAKLGLNVIFNWKLCLSKEFLILRNGPERIGRCFHSLKRIKCEKLLTENNVKVDKKINICLPSKSSLTREIRCYNRIRWYSTLSKESEVVEEMKPHTPVLLKEVIDYLDVRENGIYLDMTFGSGGHSRKILETCKNSKVVGLDRDPTAKEYMKDLEKEFPNRVIGLTGKFSDLPSLLFSHGIMPGHFNNALMDLGVSSMQFNTPARGFMLSKDGPLDMRMDADRDDDQPTAAQILEHIDEESLYKVLKYYGQEKGARVLARAFIEARIMFQSFRTTKELADFVVAVTGIEEKRDKLQRFSHPATKTFQALRILVNDEMNELDYGLRVAHQYLRMDGVLAAISFHSLEDTIVKRHFTGTDIDATPSTIGGSLSKHYAPATKHDKPSRTLISYSDNEMQDQFDSRPWKVLTKHIEPTQEEIRSNPRSRSAKLRVAAKVYDAGQGCIY